VPDTASAKGTISHDHVRGDHRASPQLCQTSNKLCAELYRKFGKEAAGLSRKLGITMKIGPLITSDHRSFFVIEADDYDNVRKFATQSGMNSVTTIPVVSFETALAELDTLTPIWHLQNEA
jgi:hypothetical protein